MARIVVPNIPHHIVSCPRNYIWPKYALTVMFWLDIFYGECARGENAKRYYWAHE